MFQLRTADLPLYALAMAVAFGVHLVIEARTAAQMQRVHTLYRQAVAGRTIR